MSWDRTGASVWISEDIPNYLSIREHREDVLYRRVKKRKREEGLTDYKDNGLHQRRQNRIERRGDLCSFITTLRHRNL